MGLGGSDAQKKVDSLRKSISREKKKLKAAIENAERQRQYRKARTESFKKLIVSSTASEAVEVIFLMMVCIQKRWLF